MAVPSFPSVGASFPSAGIASAAGFALGSRSSGAAIGLGLELTYSAGGSQYTDSAAGKGGLLDVGCCRRPGKRSNWSTWCLYNNVVLLLELERCDDA